MTDIERRREEEFLVKVSGVLQAASDLQREIDKVVLSPSANARLSAAMKTITDTFKDLQKHAYRNLR